MLTQQPCFGQVFVFYRHSPWESWSSANNNDWLYNKIACFVLSSWNSFFRQTRFDPETKSSAKGSHYANKKFMQNKWHFNLWSHYACLPRSFTKRDDFLVSYAIMFSNFVSYNSRSITRATSNLFELFDEYYKNSWLAQNATDVNGLRITGTGYILKVLDSTLSTDRLLITL